MAIFSHLDAGTDEDLWRGDPRMASLPALDPGIRDLVVIAAHPDDETLGAAGLMHDVHRRGGRVTVIVATDGEGSHPGSSTHAPADLARIRRSEVASAIGMLAPGTTVHFLGLGDGKLLDRLDRLAADLAGIVDALTIAPDARVMVVAPWSGDGHPDHRAVAEASARICRERDLAHFGYPIWLWHWGTPADVPWDEAVQLEVSQAGVGAKRRAISLHVSQIAPLSSAPGDEAVVHRAMRSHFERSGEVFIREMGGGSAESMPAESMPAEWFEDFYRRNADPWGFETRWYEQRKRRLLLASLPQERLGVVAEVGCATGLITLELAPRAERVLAMDPVRSALEAARSRLAGDDRVEFVHGRIPQDWPAGRYDTVILSEVGYYLDEEDLSEAIRLIARDLSGDGCLVACHWRHSVREYPRTGDQVHAALRAEPAWEAIARHEEPDFILEVFCPRPALSVAQREGLA